MANTKVQYIGDASTDTFTVTFPYIKEADVVIKVNDITLLPTDYEFLTPSSVRLNTVPAQDDVIDIKRETEQNTRLVNYQDGAILTEQEMDLDSIQAFYLIQEAQENYADLINDALTAIAVANGVVVTDPEDILAALVDEMIGSAAATTLQQRITDIQLNAEAILNNTTSLVDGDANLQSQINALAESVAATVYVQPNEPIPGVDGIPDPIPDAARWYDSDDNNHPYIYDQANTVWLDLEDPRIGQNAAAITALDVRLTDAEGDILTNASAISVLDTSIVTINGQITAISSDITQLQADVGTNTSNISGNATAISGLDTRVTTAEGNISSQASDISALTTRVTDAEADIVADGLAISALDTRVTSAEGTITSQSSDITALQSTVNLRARSFSQPEPAPTADNTGDLWWNETNNKLYRWNGTAWVQIEDGDISANSAAISTLQTDTSVNAGNIATNASDITALEATVNNGTTGVAANAAGLSALDVRVTTAEGNISTNAAAITAVESEVDTRATIFRQTNQPTANNIGDIWIDSDDGNKMYRWNGTIWENIQDAAISGNASAISALTTSVNTNATDIVANANAITSVESRVTTAEGDIASANVTISANTSAISTAQGDITNLQARYGVSLNVNGYVSGFSLNNSGTVSDFVILADKFKIVDPSGDAGETEFVPFSVSNGVVSIQNLVIDGSLLINGTVDAASIATLVGGLADIDANLGSITAGNITLDTAGYIRGGQTAYNTGTGFFLGYDATEADYVFSIGDGSNQSLTWDGNNLTIKGDLFVGEYQASDTEILAANTERTDTGSVGLLQKYKEFDIDKAGTIRVTVDWKVGTFSGGVVEPCSFEIRRNSTVISSWGSSTQTTYLTRTLTTVTVNAGDNISLYMRGGTRNPTEPIEVSAFVRNMKIKADVVINPGGTVLQD